MLLGVRICFEIDAKVKSTLTSAHNKRSMFERPHLSAVCTCTHAAFNRLQKCTPLIAMRCIKCIRNVFDTSGRFGHLVIYFCVYTENRYNEHLLVVHTAYMILYTLNSGQVQVQDTPRVFPLTEIYARGSFIPTRFTIARLFSTATRSKHTTARER